MRLLAFLLLLLSSSLSAQFAAEFNSILLGTAQNGGDHRIRGQFFNDEPTKDSGGNVFSFADIAVDGSHYVIDAQGKIYSIVGKGTTAIDGIDVVNTDGETQPPTTGSKIQITSLDVETNEFFISGPIDQVIKSKIQRINIIRRLQITIPDTLVGRQELLDSLANIQAPDGGVNATFVRNEIADSLATIRPIRDAEVVASQVLTSSSSFYSVPFPLDRERVISVVVNGFIEPFDSTLDGTGSGNVYYDSGLNRIVWKFSGVFSGDHLQITATRQ